MPVKIYACKVDVSIFQPFKCLGIIILAKTAEKRWQFGTKIIILIWFFKYRVSEWIRMPPPPPPGNGFTKSAKPRHWVGFSFKIKKIAPALGHVLSSIHFLGRFLTKVQTKQCNKHVLMEVKPLSPQCWVHTG